MKFIKILFIYTLGLTLPHLSQAEDVTYASPKEIMDAIQSEPLRFIRVTNSKDPREGAFRRCWFENNKIQLKIDYCGGFGEEVNVGDTPMGDTLMGGSIFLKNGTAQTQLLEYYIEGSKSEGYIPISRMVFYPTSSSKLISTGTNGRGESMTQNLICSGKFPGGNSEMEIYKEDAAIAFAYGINWLAPCLGFLNHIRESFEIDSAFWSQYRKLTSEFIKRSYKEKSQGNNQPTRLGVIERGA